MPQLQKLTRRGLSCLHIFFNEHNILLRKCASFFVCRVFSEGNSKTTPESPPAAGATGYVGETDFLSSVNVL